MKVIDWFMNMFMVYFSTSYRQNFVCDKQTKFCIENLVMMRQKGDNASKVISPWVAKYVREYTTDKKIIAQALIKEGNVHLTVLAVTLDHHCVIKQCLCW